MARQRKTLPARRQAMDDSLLIRSAESLGRMIGSLQRQLDAARRITLRPANTARGNGHAPGRTRTATNDEAKMKGPAKTAAARASANGVAGRTTKTTKKKTATKRAGEKRASTSKK